MCHVESRMFRKPGKADLDASAPFCLELAPSDLSAATLESGLTGRADRFYRTGHRLMTRGFYAESAQAFDHATRHDRSFYDAYVGLAEALVLAGRVQQAAEALERAMERFGLNCALGAARGHLYLHQQEADKALECASIANQRDPEYAYA
jgi:tetratricopeptide (TPR) repeat protein